jgi:hypothetical protein
MAADIGSLAPGLKGLQRHREPFAIFLGALSFYCKFSTLVLLKITEHLPTPFGHFH